MSRPRLPAWVLWALGLFGVVFYTLSLGTWDNLIYRPGAQVSDFTITYWPNIHYIHRALMEYGQYPLWRTSIFSGSPFDVDPQSGLWYLPNLIFFLLPETMGFNLLFLLHSLFGGIGIWYWSKSRGTSDQGAFLASLAYTFAPRMLAHLGFGHLGLFYAAAYIPWVMWGAGNVSRGRWRGAGMMGLALGMQMIAHLQLAIYTAALAGLYIVFHHWPHIRRFGPKEALVRVTRSLVGFPLAFAVAGIQILPLLRFAPYSGRAQMASGASGASALPPRYLLGLILPDHTGFADFMVYVGPPLLALALLSLRGRGARYWWLAIGFMLAYAVASGIGPLRPILGRIPLLKWLRAPARIWFVASAVIAFLSGWGFDRLQAIARSAAKAARRRLLAFGTMAFIWLLLGGTWATTGSIPWSLLHFGVSASLTLALIVLVSERGMAPGRLFLALAVLVLADLWGLDFTLIHGRTAEWVFADHAVAEELAGWIGDSFERVYSPSYSLPQQISERYGIQTVHGVDPLYLAAYDEFMQQASGVARHRYGSAIPAMEGGAPVEIANLGANPSPSLLGLLSAKYVATDFRLSVEGLKPIRAYASTYLYENLHSLPTAFFVERASPVESLAQALGSLTRIDVVHEAVVEEGQPTDNPGFDWEIQWLTHTPNRLALEARTGARSLLVVSQPWYLDWRATVDGEPATVFRADGVLMGLMLDPGTHHVVLDYRPLTLGWGILSTAVGIGLCIWFMVEDRRSSSVVDADGIDPAIESDKISTDAPDPYR